MPDTTRTTGAILTQHDIDPATATKATITDDGLVVELTEAPSA